MSLLPTITLARPLAAIDITRTEQLRGVTPAGVAVTGEVYRHPNGSVETVTRLSFDGVAVQLPHDDAPATLHADGGAIDLTRAHLRALAVLLADGGLADWLAREEA